MKQVPVIGTPNYCLNTVSKRDISHMFKSILNQIESWFKEPSVCHETVLIFDQFHVISRLLQTFKSIHCFVVLFRFVVFEL